MSKTMSKRIIINYYTEKKFEENSLNLVYSRDFYSDIDDIRDIEKNLPRKDGYRSITILGNVFSVYTFIDFREKDDSIIDYLDKISSTNKRPKIFIPPYIFGVVEKHNNEDNYLYNGKANIVVIQKYNSGASGEAFCLILFKCILSSILSGIIYDILKWIVRHTKNIIFKKIKEKYNMDSIYFNNWNTVKELCKQLKCNKNNLQLIGLRKIDENIVLKIINDEMQLYHIKINRKGDFLDSIQAEDNNWYNVVDWNNT